ncbi:MAG: CocE/NonD family hydrolase [Proteobacteria bacterium]|nr:CocE/NonD family hydrolase [Pseudomonadota bacterium]
MAEPPAGVMGISSAAIGVGEYRRAEPYRYQQALRRSVYVRMRDGVRLAVDYYRPAVNGRAVGGRFPVVFEYTRYGRARPGPGGVTLLGGRHYSAVDAAGLMPLGNEKAWSEVLLGYGYALVVADMRGSGASFGPSHAEGDDIEGKDGFDLVNWISAQSWSDGNVGMLGSSYLAEVQPRVAAERPKALRALAMVYGFFDGPNTAYAMGGIFRNGWQGGWVSNVASLDNRSTDENAPITNISPVDADREQRDLRCAVSEHRAGVDDEYFQHLEEFKTVGVVRDRLPFIDHYQLSGQNNLYTLLPRVNASRVPTLLLGGWHDIYANDMLYWYANLDVPKKLIYGPYPHGRSGPMPDDPRDAERDRIVARETLRWFDRWLRRVHNDAEQRPEVTYGLQRSVTQTEWFAADTWPSPAVHARDLFLSASSARSVLSQNDGVLTLTAPQEAARQPWRINYSTSLGDLGTRWAGNVYEVVVTTVDMKSMTYTSPPLVRDVYVAGIPVVRVMLSSEDTKDADVHAYLNAVSADGTSRLISEGMLRASHRTLGRAPYRNFDLPFPTSSSKDIANVPPLSQTPVPLEFTMVAVGRVFKKGERIRLTLAGADRGNTLAVEQSPVPRLAVQVGGGDPSWLRLPILGDRNQALFE